ncbi:MAG: hypothetical protein JXK05_06520 [Campylobacterales bacterium]|nr:hypothetical protein [Campylobacterales bacterium]
MMRNPFHKKDKADTLASTAAPTWSVEAEWSTLDIAVANEQRLREEAEKRLEEFYSAQEALRSASARATEAYESLRKAQTETEAALSEFREETRAALKTAPEAGQELAAELAPETETHDEAAEKELAAAITKAIEGETNAK